MRVLFARQPIFDRGDRVVGYELLHRCGTTNAFSGMDGRTATGQLLADSLLGDNHQRITAGLPAWINFPRELLVDGSVTLVPAANIVVEILETVPGDDEVVAACRSLQTRGYVLAADDIVDPDDRNPLVELADIVKVDFRASGVEARQKLARRFRHKRLLAEKVETVDDRRAAADLGYELVQGYYLHRPTIVEHRTIDRSRLGMMAVLAAIAEEPMDWDALERALRGDVALTDKLLRYLNSAAFAWRRPVSTLRQALVMLGERQIRRWLGVIALAALSADRPTEVLTATLVRANFCEGLAPLLGGRATALQLYLAGLYSRMHVLLSADRDETLAQAPVPDDVRAALCDRRGVLWDAVELADRWERAEWKAVAALAGRLGIDEGALADCYQRALDEVTELMQVPSSV